jgi:eukaryotic-like serine/threonine-protein kinase
MKNSRGISMFVHCSPVIRAPALALALCGTLLTTAPIALLHAQSPSPSLYELTIVNSRGNRQVLGKLPASTSSPRMSPDGYKVAFGLTDTAQPDAAARIWIADIETLAKRRLLTPAGTGANLPEVWLPDGDELLFRAAGNGVDQPDAIYRRKADGKGPADKVVDATSAQSISADGRQLILMTTVAEGDSSLALLDPVSRVATALVDRPQSMQYGASISPDGHWLAYTSDDTGRPEVWIEPLPTTGERFALTEDGGRFPLWTPDGNQIYYEHDGQIFRVFVFLDRGKPQVGELEKLPIRGFVQDERQRPFDLMPDGVRLLMLFPAK